MKNEVIELHGYIKSVKSGHRQEAGLWEREQGLKAAKESKMTSLTDHTIEIRVPEGIPMGEPFMKALLGPLARKIGPDMLCKRLTVKGGLGSRSGYWTSCGSRERRPLDDYVREYLSEEAIRMADRAAKKAKESGPRDWSEPMTLLVPDISTILRLEEDWTFRMYCEGRNSGLYPLLGLFGGHDRWTWNDPVRGTSEDVTIKAGATLCVNRIYIRQGASEYSSITFNVRKGATVDVKGKETLLKKGARFWAKLSDVNKMKVVVDRATLAEN